MARHVCDDGCRSYGCGKLPIRTADTMGEAISMSSPSGSVSRRSRVAAERRLSMALFGPGGLKRPEVPQEPEKARLMRQAATLRDLAHRGMRPKYLIGEAERLEAEAAKL